MRNIKLKHIIRAVCVVLICIIVYGAFQTGLVVTQYTIETDKLTRPIRAVLITDLHSSFYGDEQEELIAAIDAESPDIILMAGDIADDQRPHDGTIKLLDGIASRYDCYYVTGNHEFWSRQAEAIKELFRSYGVNVLEGERMVVEVKGQLINICGVDDPERAKGMHTEAELDGQIVTFWGDEHPEFKDYFFKQAMANAFDGADMSLYTILLSHRPERIGFVAGYSCDLVVSGHAHGGQWRIPFMLDGLYAPNQGLFPKYTSGVHTVNDSKMVISRGLARGSTRVPRIFNPPELVVIDIVPQE